jgi:hypothetical protein
MRGRLRLRWQAGKSQMTELIGRAIWFRGLGPRHRRCTVNRWGVPIFLALAHFLFIACFEGGVLKF